MSFYTLTNEQRTKLVQQINRDVLAGIQANKSALLLNYFSDEDTYIRKAAYQAVGKVYDNNETLRKKTLAILNKFFFNDKNPKVRQTAINTAGEIGRKDFEAVEFFFDEGLFDEDHSVRNAVIGSVKKMGEKNPKPALEWAKKYVHHPDKEVRREICHGIELRGRTHPQDILPLLKELQHDKTARVRNTLIHVLGQISYKKGCLPTVVKYLKTWSNKELVNAALEEIIDVHERYKNFAVMTQEEVISFIKRHS